MRLLSPVVIACLAGGSCCAFTPSLLAQSSSAAPASHTCNVDRSDPTEGENSLSRGDYDAAAVFYRGAIEKKPEEPTLYLGLVRALIGQDKVAEAKKTAAEAIAKFPQSSLPEVAAGEAAYRAADFEGASNDVIAAMRLDSCDAQMMRLLAVLYEATAHFAGSAKLLRSAHAIRPRDEWITRDWVGSLPREQRREELAKELANDKELSPGDRHEMQDELDYLSAHKAGECRISSKTPVTKVPFRPMFADGQTVKAYGLDVGFNGTKRLLQIDTGASGILLSYSAAKRLNLTPEYKIHTGGIGDDGVQTSFYTHVAQVTIGDVQLSNCIVEVLDKVKGGDRLEEDGLIGLDVFRHWLATLNYPDRQLILEPLPERPNAAAVAEDDDSPVDAYIAPEMKDWQHIVRIGHNVLLPAFLNNTPMHYMIMDTGADQTLLSLAFAKEAGKAHRDDSVEWHGLSGKVKEVYSLENATLLFRPVRLPGANFFAFDLTNVSHNVGTEVSGFVGLPTLSRMTITVDYRDNLVRFTYDPKHDPANYVGGSQFRGP